MARVRVRIDDFEDGVLPGVCASSGASGARLYRIDVSTRASGWLWLCVFGGPLGIVAGLVLSSVVRKTATGYVAYTEDVHAALRARARRFAHGLVACIAAFTLALVLFSTGRVGGSSGFGALGLLLLGGSLVLGLVFSFLWTNVPGSVGGTLESTGRWVVLDPVSARFAEAYEDQEAARRSARRGEVIATHLDR